MKKQSKNNGHKTISVEDMQLFREAVGEVRTVDNSSHHHQTTKKTIKVQQSVISHAFSSNETDVITGKISASEALSFHRSNVQVNVLKNLKRGKYPIEDELDLHGMTITESKQALNIFLHEVMLEKSRCVRIIHGKGYNSKNNIPVLKNFLNEYLPKFEPTLAFCSAQAADGGTGALYLLLNN